ncbi:MAG: tetratricopeptide repeat protein [Gemmatimonadales bacterium]|jgi:TolB-like protein
MSAPTRAIGACRLAVLLLLGGCAGGGALRVSDITPEAIPALEQARAQRPGDAATLARLGVAYFKAGRFADARQALDSAVARDARNGLAAIYLGMATEAVGDFPAARTAYQHYVDIARSGELRETARRRLALVGRHEMEFQARQALAHEASLSQQAPEANTVAVMPFGYTGTNAQIQPLSRGFAQLVVTDLAKSRQIRVLERERMQAMMDEMRLSDSGRADPQTALRSGRMLRASRVVQGTLAERGSDLLVSAAVVDVASAGVAASTNNSDALNRLFDLEKQVVLSIFTNLGIQLSDQERAAINQRPTQNVQAFLAYSRGLEAQDRGDYSGARDAFGEAAGLDPSFHAATQGASAASDLSIAAQQTTAQVEAAVVQNQAATGGGVTDEARRDALQQASNNVNPTQTVQQNTEQQQQQQQTQAPARQPGAEVTNTQGTPPATGTVVIVIRRPQ